MTFQFSIVLSTQPAQFQAVAFKGNLETNLAKIAGWGYDGVELAIRDPHLIDPGALCELLARHRLTVPAVGTGQAWGEERLSFSDPNAGVRRAAIERIKAHLPLAQRLDAVVIIGLVRGIVQSGVEFAQAWGWVRDALRECCEAAERAGVRLALEPVNRYESPLVNTVAQGLALIDEVAAPNLGLLFDTFHANIEETDIAASIRAVGSRLYHVHVADSNRWHPGAGHLDFAPVIAALRDAGYSDFVSGEFLPRPDADAAARQGIAYLRRIVA